MTNDSSIQVTIPLDDEGMLGRECYTCKKYFKLKPGTGLPTDYCHCPYCDYEGKSNTFFTDAQNEYLESVVMNHAFNKILKPSIDKLTETFKRMERNNRNNSFFQVKVSVSDSGFNFPIKYYSEKELETKLTCDSCDLTFSVYGVFARCPDCSDYNAFQVFEKSIEITRKQAEIFNSSDAPQEIKNQSLGYLLSSCVSSFDALGKELRKRNSSIYPSKPKNLFQNITVLNESINNIISIQHSNYSFLHKMFQVRHLLEHNMGVIDDTFIFKVPESSDMLGRKYPLTISELNAFQDAMLELGSIVKKHFKDNSSNT